MTAFKFGLETLINQNYVINALSASKRTLDIKCSFATKSSFPAGSPKPIRTLRKKKQAQIDRNPALFFIPLLAVCFRPFVFLVSSKYRPLSDATLNKARYISVIRLAFLSLSVG